MPTGFSGSYTDLTNVPSTFAPSAHVHAISDVTNLSTSLAALVPYTGATSDVNIGTHAIIAHALK